jgi:predicted MPP superfamily phosphohydrolase
MKYKVFTGDIKNVYVAGDLHGDYESFKKILEGFKKSEKGSCLLFLGDYADRGIRGLEIITELNKLLDSRRDVIALKGNHEMYINGRPFFSPCDLIYEAEAKYTSWERFYQEVMIEFLAKLYIAAIINNVLFVHAGISSKIKTIKDLGKKENEIDLLWSDPSPLTGEHPNLRGAGITFGEDITTKVLSSLGLKMIVRSHEPRKAAYGPYLEHKGKIITTNSCASYGEPWKPFILKIETRTLQYEPIFL